MLLILYCLLLKCIRYVFLVPPSCVAVLPALFSSGFYIVDGACAVAALTLFWVFPSIPYVGIRGFLFFCVSGGGPDWAGLITWCPGTVTFCGVWVGGNDLSAAANGSSVLVASSVSISSIVSSIVLCSVPLSFGCLESASD